MKYIMFYLFGVSLALGTSANATSFGRKANADIATIDNKPAICLPNKESPVFRLGWVSLSEGDVRNPASWGIALREGAQPTVLHPGDCVVFGTVPDGYENDDLKVKARPLKLEINRVYIFRLSDAYRPRDTYAVIFSIGRAADGTQEYLRYDRTIEYGELVPPRHASQGANDK